MEVIKLRRNKNIRDLGGNYHGIKIKRNMLIRGRTFLDLTEAQMKILLEKYHLRTIIDLRSIPEAMEKPEKVIPGTLYVHLPVFEESKAGITREEAVKAQNALDLYRKLPPMEALYFDMLHGDSLNNLSKIVKYIILKDVSEHSIYFHCSEGKDRTGLVAAILMLILGVDKKSIIDDYMYTNKVARAKAFKYYMTIKYLKFDYKFAIKVGRLLLAKKEYIEILFDVIKTEYGSEEAFFKNGLKLTDEEINRFKDKMLIKD